MPNYETEAKKKLEAQIKAMEQSNISNGGAAYNLYVEKLKALNEFTKEQYEKDSFGLNKKLTPEKFRQLKQLYADCGKQGEIVLKELKAYDGKPGYGVIQSIHNILSDDMKVLNAVDETILNDETVSLQKLVDEARMRTVDISGKNLGTLGANMSSRIPFNYVEADGHQLPGVFTPKSEFDMEANYDRFVESLKAQAPGYAPIFDSFKKVALKFANDELTKSGNKPEQFTDGEKLYVTVRLMAGPNYEYSADDIKDGMKKIDNGVYQQFCDYFNSNEGKDEFEAFSDLLFKYHNQVGVNYGNASISDHSRIDSRNSAMSAVADLLGVPNLICRAIPMKVVKDGVEIEGTFMSMAEGVDIKTPSWAVRDYAYKPDGSVFTATNGYKDVADLQVLDFICGNVDRHCGNMFYKFDDEAFDPDEHKFLGVQGIDNDASFGTFVPSSIKENRARLASLNGMKVISESMAIKVMSLDKEMLAFTLRNQGLTEPQIEAAKGRLNLLRFFIEKSNEKFNNLSEADKKYYTDTPNAIVPNTIRLVKDNEFNKLNIVDMCVGGHKTNTFNMVHGFRKCCISEMKENPGARKKEPQKIEEKKVFILDENEARWAEDIVQKLNNATAPGRSSKYYEAVQTAAKRYKSFCETNKGSVLSEDMYDIRTKYLEDINKCSKAYVDYKKSVSRPSDYTRLRIDTVTEIFNQAGSRVEESFYEKMMNDMDDKERERYADGLHAFADRSLDDFNARMRKMAEEIARQNGIELPGEKAVEGEGLVGAQLKNEQRKMAEPVRLI